MLPSLSAPGPPAPVQRRRRAQQQRQEAVTRRKAKRDQLNEPAGETGYLARRRVKPASRP